jgi:IS5 family transposase
LIQNSFFENIPSLIINQSIIDNISKEEKVITKERKQFSLFGDNWIYKHILEKFPDHPLIKLKPLVDKILKEIESNIEVYYRKDFGRPSYPASVIFKMLLLEYLYNLSDLAVSQSVCCNILFRWFCGLDIDDVVPDDTTLVKFRKRIGEEGFREIFTAFIKQAKELGYGKGKLRIIDATHVISFSRGLSFAGLVKDGIKRVIKRAKEKTITIKEVTLNKALKVIETKRVTVQELKQVVRRLTKELSNRVDSTTEKVINQIQAVISESKKLGSLVDTDARWGYKSKDFPFFGYKAHLACDERGFVTNLEVLSGEKNEGNRIKELLETEPKTEQEVKLEGVCADALYDSAKNREYLKSVGIKPYIPARTKSSGIDKFTIEADAVRCVVGKHSIGKIEQENGYLYYYSTKDCRGCDNYEKCVSPEETRKKVYLSNCKVLRDEINKERLGIRKLIERLFGWGKRWLGLSRARYCGIGKVIIQVIMTFLAIDLKTMIRGPC